MGVANQVEQPPTIAFALLYRGESRPEYSQLRRAPLRGRRAFRRRGVQEVAHLVVGDLGEVPVVLAHREERRRCRRADHFVDLGGQLLACRFGGGRHRHDDPLRPEPMERQDRSPHARSGGQPVVDEDHHLAVHIEGRPVPAVGLFASLQLKTLSPCDLLDDLCGDPHAPHDIVIEDHDATAGDRPHRHFLMTWDAQLANNEHVQRHLQRRGNLVAHGHSTPRQCQHDNVIAPVVMAEHLCQHPTGIPAIVKDALRHTRGLAAIGARRIPCPRSRSAKWATHLSCSAFSTPAVPSMVTGLSRSRPRRLGTAGTRRWPRRGR